MAEILLSNITAVKTSWISIQIPDI